MDDPQKKQPPPISYEDQQLKDTFKEIFDNCYNILNTKGKEYSRDNDRFSNFKSCAKEANVSIYQVFLIFMKKHFDAISHYCRGEKQYSNEDIESRIFDMINYLILLYTMIKIQKANKDR